jgi:hypothetical protein
LATPCAAIKWSGPKTLNPQGDGFLQLSVTGGDYGVWQMFLIVLDNASNFPPRLHGYVTSGRRWHPRPGPGIAKEDCRISYDRFYKSKARQQNRLGAGLAIAEDAERTNWRYGQEHSRRRQRIQFDFMNMASATAFLILFDKIVIFY